LLAEATGEPVEEARIRYHAENVLVKVPIDENLRLEVTKAVARARELRTSITRPPVTTNDRACLRCSLAPVCLPEEERLAKDPEWQAVCLSPTADERTVVHVLSHGSRVGKSGDEIRISPLEGADTKLPIHETRHLVIHGGAQITSQAIHMCVEHDVAVSWLTGGGRYIGTVAATGSTIQRRIQQYEAMRSPETRLSLAKRLAMAKIEGQLRFLLRATRGHDKRANVVVDAVNRMRACLRGAHACAGAEDLLGFEGQAAASYFASWSELISEGIDERMRFQGRSRRPPRDRVSALLGFAYAMLLKDVTAAAIAVGLEPALGFYHQPRSAAPPLALDMMELFRVPMVDMPIVGSINRNQWDPVLDFEVTVQKIWLSESGRRKLIDVYERRREEQWKHSVVGYSLSYGRMIELEFRLLEKEWQGNGGLFAKFRLR